MPSTPRIFACCLALAAALAASTACAADPGIVQPGEEKFTLMLGGFLPAIRSKVEVDAPDGSAGDRLDANGDLGMDRETSGGWLGAEWRFARRHRIGFTYTRFTLSGERATDRDLTIRDQTYPAGTTLNSHLRFEITPITYSYSLIKRPNDEFALTAGLHWSRVTFGVESAAGREVSAKADVPLPLLGVRYDHNFSERWSAGISAAAFSLRFAGSVLDYKGSLASVRLHGEYRLSHHVALGAALEAFKVTVDASESDWKGDLQYSYWGPQLYLTARF